MSKIKFKKLNMSDMLNKKILLNYFFKKEDTVLDRKELLSMACIDYNSEQKKITAHTTRVKKALKTYQNSSWEQQDVDEMIQDALKECFSIHEELVRCELQHNGKTDYFYIAVIGVDFFLIESELRKNIEE